MKKIFILNIFLLSFSIQAQEKILCSLSWLTDGQTAKLELISLTRGCEFPEGNRTDCAILRFTTPEGQVREGASPIRSGAENFCLNKQDVEIFGASNINDPIVWVKCDRGFSKAFLHLQSPNKQFSKNCPFPILKKGQ